MNILTITGSTPRGSVDVVVVVTAAYHRAVPVVVVKAVGWSPRPDGRSVSA
jgi:NAD(P)H-dependent FMN reductase